MSHEKSKNLQLASFFYLMIQAIDNIVTERAICLNLKVSGSNIQFYERNLKWES